MHCCGPRFFPGLGATKLKFWVPRLQTIIITPFLEFECAAESAETSHSFNDRPLSSVYQRGITVHQEVTKSAVHWSVQCEQRRSFLAQCTALERMENKNHSVFLRSHFRQYLPQLPHLSKLQVHQLPYLLKLRQYSSYDNTQATTILKLRQ